MGLQLFKASTGEVAFVANRILILDGEAQDDSRKLVEKVAERVSIALALPLSVVEVNPSDVEWNWESLLLSKPMPEATLSAAPVPVCGKCGSHLVAGACSDQTCPYSDWPQRVYLDDMETYSADELVVRYGLVRAEVHSDDRAFEVDFDASEWLVSASDSDIRTMADEEWGQCEVADEVARHFESRPAINALFDYLNSNPARRGSVGFEVTVNEDDALRWLRLNRYGLWAQLICEKNDVSLSRAEEPEIRGMWDWCGNGQAGDRSFDSGDEAALDAVEQLGLDSLPPVQPLFLGFWGNDAFHTTDGEDKWQIAGHAMFGEEMAYSPMESAEIRGLPVGGLWVSHDYGSSHTVKRIR